jgi:transposase
MKAPKDWKSLKRHPLSAEYGNIDGPEWEKFVGSIRQHGIVNDRRVTLYQGNVLDGFQLLRACVEADIEPRFQELPGDIAPETFVEIMNDRRRHEDAETVRKRAQARRERVAAARANGESTRSIAEVEGVSEKTIRNDLDALTAEGTQCESPDGKTKGKDGRKQPAARKRRKTKKSKTRPLSQAVDAESDGELKDSLRVLVPPGLRGVFEAVATFRGALSQITEIKTAINTIAGTAAGLHLHPQEVTLALDNARRAIRFAIPYAVCPVCKGSGKTRRANCPCKDAGWLPEDNYRILLQEYRS